MRLPLLCLDGQAFEHRRSTEDLVRILRESIAWLPFRKKMVNRYQQLH